MAPKIKIQRPAPGPFTRNKLIWDKSSTVYIPAERFLDFVLGEQLQLYPQTVFLIQKLRTHASCPSRTEDSIYSERRRWQYSHCEGTGQIVDRQGKASPRTKHVFLTYWNHGRSVTCRDQKSPDLSTRLSCSYHCAWGPEDDFYNPDVNPMSKPSIQKLGCLCRFEYRKLHSDPNVVCIYFEQKKHIDRNGIPVHGPLDPGFLNLHRFQSTLSVPLKLWVYSRLQAKATASQILAEHRENRLSVMQQKGVNYFCDGDDFMKMTDIRSISSAVKKGTWKYLAKYMRPHQQGAQLGTMKELPASEVSVHPAGPTDVSRLRVMAMEDESCDGSGDDSCHHMTESMWAEMKAVSKRARLEELSKKRQHSSLE